MNPILATADALTTGAGLVLLAGLAAFITVLLAEHIQTIRTSIQKENHRHDR